jgi:acyl homoserine lactone synthase
MSHSVSTYHPSSTPAATLEGMFRLRYQVFHEKLGWEVQTTPDGLERDAFDDLEEVSYVLATDRGGRVDGCWRLLPTTGPYMLRDTFPELLHGLPAPCSSDCFELSRFAVATDRVDTANASVGPIAMALMRESAAFAIENNVARYVTVTTPVMERMLKQQGVHLHRLGPSIRIGVASAVAIIIEVDDQTLAAVGANRPQCRDTRNSISDC